MSSTPFDQILNGKLAKLTIIGFPDATKIPKIDGKDDPSTLLSISGEIVKPTPDSRIFTVMYNPSQYQRKHGSKNVAKFDSNTGAAIPVENQGPTPGNISFDFILDATGASPSSGNTIKNIIKGKKGVDDQVDNLLETAYYSKEKTHVCNHIWMVWGTSFFSGTIDSVTINYTLFDKRGRPLRAKVNFNFIESDHFKIQKAKQIQQSPDVSKTRTVKAGDTLLLLAKEMYDDESLYLEVARINNLKNYRRLTPGQVLVFPPINQKED